MMKTLSAQKIRSSVKSAKRGTISLSRSGFNKLGKTLGFSTRGISSKTFVGNQLGLIKEFRPIAKIVTVNPQQTAKVRIKQARGIQVGPKIQRLTVEVGKSLPRTTPRTKVPKVGNIIPKEDISLFRNFGLRRSGEVRTGYTLGQCFFSAEYVRGGSQGDLGRYGIGGNPNKSAAHLTKVHLGLVPRVSKGKK